MLGDLLRKLRHISVRHPTIDLIYICHALRD